ncbi:protein-methionine-sulfoxide reductase heme-binding subunit MsrQ [uncultured Jannaschia sp.]|uniref:sulfite oxidase heme-binding subunit YedZ n=1 Tax=uncultured Jannaschia sp. TaxID=293347 RepID=UPI0026167D27|nr:protein-methionine-sulfoxide reductase heme-binding subunit MsrQ [uncultured Jannaschia sp.]
MNAITAYGPRISGLARRVPSWIVYALGCIPGLLLLQRGMAGQLGIDPVETLEHEFGMLAFQFLLGSLTITPILRFARINLLKFRRALGLLSFGYLVLHLLVWLLLDQQLRLELIAEELSKRRYLIIGLLAFLLLVPLAVTSWSGAVRRMGAKNWVRLHRSVYIATILGGVHYIMQEKVWATEPLIYLGAAILLVGIRAFWLRAW